jgi:hypothetical protein
MNKPRGNPSDTFRGPKKFVPLDAYQPGSLTAPVELSMPPRSTPMGIATIIEEVKASTPAPMPKHAAGVMHIGQDGNPINPRQIPPPALPDADSAPDEVIVKSSRATRVLETPVETEEAPVVSEQEPGTEVDKVRLNAQRKISEQGAELAALRQQVNDMLAATTRKPDAPAVHPALAPPDLAALQKEIDAVGKNFLDDPEGSAKKIMELSMKAAQASIVPILKQNEERSMLEATKSLVKQYPGLVNNKAEAAYVDVAAELLAQEDGYQAPTLDHMQKALDAYAKKVGWTKAPAGAVPNAEVDGMKRDASSTAPATASTGGKSKGKIWRKSELDALLTRQPEKYRELQPEIMRAYREGRVK